MPRLLRSAVLCLGVAACSLFDESEFPDAAVQIMPPSRYRAWWDVVESCSGNVLPFESISWFTVPPGHLDVRGESAAGVWYGDTNRIVIAQGWRDDGPLVRHEMLHALLNTSAHPAEFFQSRCADLVACSGECEVRPVLPNATEVAAEVLQVSITLFPRAPSVTLHEGWATIVVDVHNPSGGNVFVPFQRFTSVTCPVGYFIVSASRPDRHDAGCAYLDYDVSDLRVYFRPRERRRLVFEADLRAPDSGGSFEDEVINVSAVYLDRIQEPTQLRIRP